MNEDRYMACLIEALQKEEPSFKIYPSYNDFGIEIVVYRGRVIPFDKSEVRKLKDIHVHRVAEAVIALIWDRLTDLKFTPVGENTFQVERDNAPIWKSIKHDIVLNKLSFLESK